MPMPERPDDDSCYEEFGPGLATLLFARGGLRSCRGMWNNPANGPQPAARPQRMRVAHDPRGPGDVAAQPPRLMAFLAQHTPA